MAKKRPYTITEHDDKTVTLQVGDVREKFGSRKSLEAFAYHLYEMAHSQWVGMFRLKEKDDGSVDLIFNGSESIIHAKNYGDLCKLADCIVGDLEDSK